MCVEVAKEDIIVKKDVEEKTKVRDGYIEELKNLKDWEKI